MQRAKYMHTPPRIAVLDGRAVVSAHLARAGAEVVEAGPDAFSAACVSTYLRAKYRARL